MSRVSPPHAVCGGEGPPPGDEHGPAGANAPVLFLREEVQLGGGDNPV